MDFFERLNRVFGSWYESLFGDIASDIRPKDVLRKIINTMEDNRKEGLDNRIYVPNKYVLEIAFSCDEEREYLLAFLDKAEFETALRKYMAQNQYYTRGPLDFTIEEVSPPEAEARPEKLKVKCKWDVRAAEKDTSPVVVSGLAKEGSAGLSESYEEEYTVAAADLYDESTVAPPSLLIEGRIGPKREFLLTKPVTIIGRSRRLGNDLVLDWDGMVSKRHAKITLTSEGFTIFDLDSTNGVWVNGEKVVGSNGKLLNNGDTIRLGVTELIFKEKAEKHAPDTASIGSIQLRPKLVFDDGSEFLL
ncbi:MAG: FhaA domain-containing protein, partial [Armatimonadota bacterium]